MDMISNNLANANTAGFKKDKISFQEYLVASMNGRTESTPDGRTMSYFGSVTTDQTPGSVVHTGNDLDIAIDGEGFLCLENGDYTRRGDMHLDGEGYLVNQRGIKILGTGGPIQITDKGKISINSEGEVSVKTADTLLSVVDTIKVVTFSDPSVLSKSGDDAFAAGTQEATTVTASVAQGYLEKSNVDAVKEMVQMITALREFETYQKAIQSFDESLGRVLSEMPRI